ncbi:hypothetical protein B7Y94_05410 [Candidatus Saccharibacteria bacterium 32-49-12]|nr:MAG: hypothetical protein B7Y94_05410 [Candidatus Saccharibacteria bacterium 32-49-12]
MNQKARGFTIVELLIVIVVIGILAAISIVAYNTVQGKAADSRRKHDMATIQRALQAYNVLHGGVPRVSTYNGGSGFGGWDVSTHSTWLSFLRGGNGNMPVDPLNSTVSTIDPNVAGNYVYRYFCYDAGSWSSFPDSANVVIGYRSASNIYTTFARFRVDSCLTAVP